MKKRRMRRIGEPKEPYIFLSKLDGKYVKKYKYETLKRRLEKIRKESNLRKARIQSLTNRFNSSRLEFNNYKKEKTRTYLKLYRNLNRTRNAHAKSSLYKINKIKELRAKLKNARIVASRNQKSKLLLSKKLREQYNARIKLKEASIKNRLNAVWRFRMSKIRQELKNTKLNLKTRTDRLTLVYKKLDNQRRYTKYERKLKHNFKSKLVSFRKEKNDAIRKINVERRALNKHIATLQKRLKEKPKVVYKERKVRVKVEKVVEVVPTNIKKLEKKFGDIDSITQETSRLIELNARTNNFLTEQNITLNQLNALLLMKDLGNITKDILQNLSSRELNKLVSIGLSSKDGKTNYFITFKGEELVKSYLELMRKRTTIAIKQI